MSDLIPVYILHDLKRHERRVFYTLAAAQDFAKKNLRREYSIYKGLHSLKLVLLEEG